MTREIDIPPGHLGVSGRKAEGVEMFAAQGLGAAPRHRSPVGRNGELRGCVAPSGTFGASFATEPRQFGCRSLVMDISRRTILARVLILDVDRADRLVGY
jgi:hypothetical protein